MVKASQILEDMCFEKEAAARWRKEFGNLSNVAKDTLRRDLVSQPNETAKRLRGQDNMMKKFNIGRVVMSDAQPSSKFEKYILNKVGPAYKKGWFSGAYYDHFSEGKNSGKPNFKGLKGVSRYGKANLKKIYKTDRSLYDEIASIIGHHESGGEGLVDRKKIDNKVSKYFSHFSPEVLHRESATVATASPKAQEFMKNLRSKKYFAGLVGLSNDKTGYKPWQRVSEADELRRIGGIEYAKGAVVDKEKLKKHINAYK